MRILLASFFALTALALQPTVAEASGCYRGPFAPLQLPAGCPITVFQETSTSPGAPTVFAQRDGAMVDVTASVTKEPSTLLDVGHPTYDCNGDIASVELFPTPYDVYTVTVTNAIVGENLLVGGWPVRVTPAATCVELARPEPLCGYIPDRCEPDEIDPDEIDPDTNNNGGCNTGGGSAGIAMALVALALALRTRR